jgi:hypothetical protein
LRLKRAWAGFKDGPLLESGVCIGGALAQFCNVRVLICTASNSAGSMIGGAAISTTAAPGLRSRIFQNLF